MKSPERMGPKDREADGKEKPGSERDARHERLSKRREDVAAGLAATETEARDAEKTVREMDAFMEEQADLDPMTREEMTAVKMGAEAAVGRFEELKAELAELDAALGSEGIGETIAEEVVTSALMQHFIPAPAVRAVVENVLPGAKDTVKGVTENLGLTSEDERERVAEERLRKRKKSGKA
jgi:hypothetical protein